MSASRSSRRSARLAASALFAGLALLAALSACSAGQISQTSTQVAAVPGANLTIGDPNVDGIALRDLAIAYLGPQGYPQGGSAPLVVRIFNIGPSTVTLVKVTTDAARGVVLVGGPVLTPAATATRTTAPTATAPTRTAPPTPTTNASGTPSGSAVPPGSATSNATPTPTVAAQAGQEKFSIAIASVGYALLVPGQGAYLQLVGLKSALLPGQSVHLSFTFADGRTGDIVVPVSVPQGAQPRPTEHVDVNKVGDEGH